jgi:uncharacterized protein (DUF2267 family)
MPLDADATPGETMNFDEFTGQVQHHLELANTGETLRATRAVLTTLGERLQEGEATDLAGSLPLEIDRYLTAEVDEHAQRFGLDEFMDRVSERARVERPEALYYGQVLVALVSEMVPGGEMQQVRDQLPDEWDDLWELADETGSLLDGEPAEG